MPTNTLLAMDDIRADVDNFLINFFKNKFPTSLYEPIRYVFAGGGKRLRPTLTVLSAIATANNEIYEKALRAGAAIEILHNFTLVHDDIMDKSNLRRGRQTVHNRWNDAAAILSGDAMLGAAYDILIESAEGNPNFSEIIRSFTAGLVGVCEGQALDLDFQYESIVSMERYLLMIELKTSKLLEICSEIGSMLGNGTPQQTIALKKFAKFMGIAFQIQDDYLDLTGSEAEFGKTIGNDILEGKKTYLIVRAAELRPSGKDGELLEKFICNRGLPVDEILIMADMLKRCGALDDAKNAVKRYANEAADSLGILPDSPVKDALLLINDRLIKRRY